MKNIRVELRPHGDAFEPFRNETEWLEVMAREIKANVTVWELRFNSAEAKLDVHREKWKAAVPDPRKRIREP